MSALADVIWEPQDDFYYSHSEDCEYLYRDYLLNGSKGYVEVYKSPDSSVVLDVIPNEQALRVYFSYPKGDPQWGVVNYMVNGQGQVEESYEEEAVVGWISMDSLIAQYDNTAFQTEHADQLAPYDDQSLPQLPTDTVLLMWRYPGSDTYYEHTLSLDSSYPEFSLVYTDPDGRNWANCNYYMGLRDFWVCLDDPTNPDLPVTEIHYENLVPAANPDEINASTTALSPAILAGILVAGVVVVTLILLKKYRKKNEA